MLKQMARWFIVLVLCRIAVLAQQPPPNPAEDYSGMYAFLRDGEFLQITVEEGGRVTGFISRYGELERDRGAFLDQFFRQGKV